MSLRTELCKQVKSVAVQLETEDQHEQQEFSGDMSAIGIAGWMTVGE